MRKRNQMEVARRYNKNTQQYNLGQNTQAYLFWKFRVKHVGGPNQKYQTAARPRFSCSLSLPASSQAQLRPHPREMTLPNFGQKPPVKSMIRTAWCTTHPLVHDACALPAEGPLGSSQTPEALTQVLGTQMEVGR